MYRKGKSIKKQSKLVISRGCEREKWRVTTNEDMSFFWGDKEILKVDSGDGCIIL